MKIICSKALFRRSFILTVTDQTRKPDGYFGSPYDDANSYPIIASLNGLITDLWRTITGQPPRSWFAITLPEQLLIPRVKIYSFDVSLKRLRLDDI